MVAETPFLLIPKHLIGRSEFETFCRLVRRVE
jgi:hypothetical protein